MEASAHFQLQHQKQGNWRYTAIPLLSPPPLTCKEQSKVMKAEEECQMITKSPWTSPSHSQKHLPPSLLSAPLSVSKATTSIASTSRAQASAQGWEMQLLTTAEGLQSDLLLTGMHSAVMNMTTLPCTLYMSFLRTFKLHLESSLKICLFFLCAWKGITYKSVKTRQISP